MLRLIDKERVKFTGNYTTGNELNEFRIQVKYGNDLLKISITNRSGAIYLLNGQNEWTTLKEFNEFRFYNNLASNFLVDVSKYLNSLYDTDEFDSLTD